nr:MAG TPA: hypothetical protein [Caudoviricetes sp.]
MSKAKNFRMKIPMKIWASLKLLIVSLMDIKYILGVRWF